MIVQEYNKNENVVEAAKKRISGCFDEFENISVSISGGKDSTVLAHLVLSEAARRKRKAKVFFLDEEVDYTHTIDQIRYIMFDMEPDAAIPIWLQIPMYMTNATSYLNEKLYIWDPDRPDLWMREKEPCSIKAWPFPMEETKISNKKKGFGFYDCLHNWEAHQDRQCSFVGLRARESPNRWRAVSKHPGFKNWTWTTKGTHGNINAYPLYDWEFEDIWKYIYDTGIQYNKIYDWMWMKGVPIREIRVSSLIHEKSFKALVELPEFEPTTYDRLCKRISGIQTANLYGKEDLIMKCQKLPTNFTTWKDYRDFLMQTLPRKDLLAIFERRFRGMHENQYVWRQQCRQLILNDYENNLPIKDTEDPRKEKIAKWANMLI